MDAPSPKGYTVSVIVTVFNRKRLLKRAVDSLLKQTYKSFEVIIVDDGSTDGVEQYLSRLVLRHKNFSYIKHSNRGTALSLNAGIMLARGKFISFLDSDDMYKPDHLRKRILFLGKRKDIDLTCSTAKIIGKEQDMYVPDAGNRNKLIHLNECVIGGTFFGKREVFVRLKGFKSMYSHDSDFWKRASKSFNLMKLEVPTYIYYRNTPDSIINQLKGKVK
jgi:glycosyltransferase involved in cell wall biosynthesis